MAGFPPVKNHNMIFSSGRGSVATRYGAGSFRPSNPAFVCKHAIQGMFTLFLKYPSLFHFVQNLGMAGFEPTTSSSRTKRASQAALHPDIITICFQYTTKLFLESPLQEKCYFSTQNLDRLYRQKKSNKVL